MNTDPSINYSGINTQNFLDQFEMRLEEAAIQYKDSIWKHYLGHTSDANQSIENELTGIMMNPELYHFLSDQIRRPQDEITQRQIFLLLSEIKKMRIDGHPDHIQAVGKIRDHLNQWMISVGGKQATVYQLQQAINHQPNRNSRKNYYESLEPGLLKTGAFWESLIDVRNRLARDHGYEDYTAFALSFTEIDASVLPILREPSLEFQKNITDASSQRDRIFPCESWDLSFHISELNRKLNEVSFPADKAQAAILEYLISIGFHPDDLSLQTVDAGPEFPTICIPVFVPSDIRMFIGTGSSWDSYAHMIQEYGMACHYCMIKEDRYILKSVNPVWIHISAGVFYQFLTSEEFLKKITADDVDLTGWLSRKKMRDELQFILFSCLAEFEFHMYNTPFRDLDALWEKINRTYFGYTDRILPDWMIQEWFISRPFRALELAVSNHYSRHMYDYLKKIPQAEWSGFLTENIFQYGNRQSWRRLISNCMK